MTEGNVHPSNNGTWGLNQMNIQQKETFVKIKKDIKKQFDSECLPLLIEGEWCIVLEDSDLYFKKEFEIIYDKHYKELIKQKLLIIIVPESEYKYQKEKKLDYEQHLQNTYPGNI